MDIIEKIKQMPKVELHVHVEGAVSAETYYNLAKQNNIQLPAKDLQDWKNYFEFKDFAHFINVYVAASKAVVKPSDYTFLIEEFYRNQSEQNIVYSEAFFSASLIIEKYDEDEILEAMALGMKNGEAKYKVKANFIPDIARQIPESQSKVVDFILKGQKKGLFIGLGLGGMEKGFPPGLFIDSYKKAKECGLRIVAHAGEADGASSIWGALKNLKAERIGHGVRCLEDEALVQYLKETQIPLEVSPTSNYRLKIVKDSENHPIRTMVDKGIYCTVNSDDPAMFSTSLNDEYILLHKQGFSWDELWQLNINAINASFLNGVEKKKLLNNFETFKNKTQ